MTDHCAQTFALRKNKKKLQGILFNIYLFATIERNTLK